MRWFLTIPSSGARTCPMLPWWCRRFCPGPSGFRRNPRPPCAHWRLGSGLHALSQSLEEEGLCLLPTYLLHGGVMPEATFAALGSLLRGAHPSPGAWRTAPGLEDFAAQLASAQAGATALSALAEKEGARQPSRRAWRPFMTMGNALHARRWRRSPRGVMKRRMRSIATASPPRPSRSGWPLPWKRAGRRWTSQAPRLWCREPELPGGGDRGSGVLRFSLPHAAPNAGERRRFPSHRVGASHPLPAGGRGPRRRWPRGTWKPPCAWWTWCFGL